MYINHDNVNMFWVLKRITSLRQLFCVLTIYILVEKLKNYLGDNKF